VLAACDHEWECRHLWTEGIATRPSETLRRQMYVNFWFEAEGIKLRHHIGIDNIMWESDFPHVASFYPRSWESIERVVDGVPPEDRRKLWEAHVRALIAHRTKPYAGRITLLRTRGHPMVCSFDDELGWREFAGGGVTMITIPGAHESALDEPHVRTLAEIVKRHLDKLQTAGPAGGNP